MSEGGCNYNRGASGEKGVPCASEAYPRKVAALPPDLFSTLMGTLEFGLKHANAEVARESLAALGAMGSFQHKAVAEAAAASANPQTAGRSTCMSLLHSLVRDYLLIEYPVHN